MTLKSIPVATVYGELSCRNCAHIMHTVWANAEMTKEKAFGTRYAYAICIHDMHMHAWQALPLDPQKQRENRTASV